jgi:hypothetical protein
VKRCTAAGREGGAFNFVGIVSLPHGRQSAARIGGGGGLSTREYDPNDSAPFGFGRLESMDRGQVLGGQHAGVDGKGAQAAWRANEWPLSLVLFAYASADLKWRRPDCAVRLAGGQSRMALSFAARSSSGRAGPGGRYSCRCARGGCRALAGRDYSPLASAEPRRGAPRKL